MNSTIKEITSFIVSYPISVLLSKTFNHNFSEGTMKTLVGISFISIALSFYNKH